MLQGEAEVARCVAEANVFALAAHQYWGPWSLLQVGMQPARACCAACSACLQLPNSHQHSKTPPLLPPLSAQCPQAKWSSIDFDYLSYAQLRWAEYRRRRDEFLAAAAAAFQEQQQ